MSTMDKFSFFSKHKHTIISLIIISSLFLTSSILFFINLYSCQPVSPRPFEGEKENVYKQTLKKQRIYSAVPLDLRLDVLVKPGTEFHISGLLLTTEERFFIDLRSTSKGNVSLHFNPHFRSSPFHRDNRDAILISASVDGEWMSEGSVIYPKPFGIEAGKKFVIQIKCEEEQFRTFINGAAISFFEYRLPIESITNVFIAGEVDLDTLEIITPVKLGVGIGI